MRILVVEDDSKVAALISSGLEEHGFAVDTGAGWTAFVVTLPLAAGPE